MINVSASRNKCGNTVHFYINKPTKTGDAIVSAIQHELGFGGEVTELSETRLTIRTIVMGCVDSTTFEGTVEEMQPLFEACMAFLAVSEQKDIDVNFKQLSVKGTIRPLVAVNFLPIAIGQTRMRKTFITLLSETEEDIPLFLKLSENDLIAAVRLKYNDNASAGDLRALAA